MDFFVIDLVNKKVILFDNNLTCNLDEFRDVENIDIFRDIESGNKIITFLLKNNIKIIIIIDKYNKIISCMNSNLYNVKETIINGDADNLGDNYNKISTYIYK